MTRRPLLLIGLDGADLDVVRPLAAAGALPTLGAWMAEGAPRPLASTVPPMSFPAWSSFATGRDPGAHGLFDFTQKVPGAYRLEFVNASHRAGATLFARASAAGARVLGLGMPATWPPDRVAGLVVPGFDAPVSAGSSAGASSDPALYRRIAARAGPWMTRELDEGATGEGWHERMARALPARVARKTRFALAAIDALRREGRPPDVVSVVFAESDTVAHHFWRDHDPRSPRRAPGASAARRGAVAAVYQALDAACGALREAMGPDALCVVLSDHGSGGAAARVVHLNRRLEECGLLRRASGRPALDRAARGVRDAALRALPPGLAERLFRRLRPAAARLESAARFGGFDWARTAAFSEEANTQPGVWLNLAGREAGGSVTAADRERVLREVAAALLDWKLPDGSPVVRRARPREEVYAGPFVSRAPDLVLELGSEAGYGLSLVPTPWPEGAGPSLREVPPREGAGGRGRGLNGVHRTHGLQLAVGPGAAAVAGVTHLADLAPACFAAVGLPWTDDPDSAPPPRTRAYARDEEAEVAARLRALGYLDGP